MAGVKHVKVAPADDGSEEVNAAEWNAAHAKGDLPDSLNAFTLAQLNTAISDANVDDSGDPRTPSAHDLSGALHNASTLANFNTKISDATLLDTTDIQYKAGTLHTAGDHESGGALQIKLDDFATPDDNTDLNVSITAHGLCPKLPNDATKYLNGVGAYTVPGGGADTRLTVFASQYPVYISNTYGTRWASVLGQTAYTAEARMQIRVPAGTVKKLKVECKDNTLDGQLDVKLRKNGATIHTFNIAAGNTALHTAGVSYAFAEDDLINWELTENATAGTAYISLVVVLEVD